VLRLVWFAAGSLSSEIVGTPNENRCRRCKAAFAPRNTWRNRMSKNNQQGTGKHGHKDTEEPYPHHETAKSKGREQGSKGEQSQQGGAEHNASLKQREYTDEKGEVHHHTKTYMEQHGKD